MVDAIFLVSVSILLILLVRKIFAKHVPARLLYALWLLPVLFMLLFCLPFVKVKENQIMIRIGGRTLHLLVGGDGPVLLRIFPNLYDILEKGLNRILFANQSFTVKHLGAAKQGFVLFPAGISVWEVGKVIWLLGAVVTAVLLLVPYVRMWLYLKRNRVLYPERVCGQKVYLVEGLRSSFLLCGKIYIDSEQQKDAVCFSNVVRHELTHRRHGDDIWNLVRTLCVVAFWFHPLVWIAAFVSKTDSEYACDEGVLKKMTAQERRSYGINLLELATKGKGSVKGNFFVYGIGGGELKERIVRVTAKKGKGVWLKTIAFFVLVIGISCGFLYVAHCGIVRLVESDSYNLALKYAELPASDKVCPASCTYEDGLFHVTLIPETEENCEVIYKWLEYEEDGEFGLVMKNNLKADKKLRCVGGKDVIEMQYEAFHAKKGQARCAFGEVHKGETFIYNLADYLEEDFGENYPELMQGDYRMNYVLCSHETGELELLSVPFSVPAEGPFKVWWFSANRH